MIKVIGVRFRSAGKIYYFSPGELEIKTGDRVIVETARGVEYGKVVLGNRDVEDDKVIPPLKQVIRMATPADEEIQRKNREKAKEAYRICQEKIAKHELEMKLIDVEYTFDNNKILFYFTADGRVDFRELVRDLAGEFKTRIELRQVGVRDETKMIGGYGICGRDLCCHAYLSDFSPVSIKMAKEQNLSLNPTKISGACGRLMCCLGNEEEVYEEINKRMPGVGDTATAPDGVEGTIISVNVLRETARMVVDIGDDREIREYAASELQFEKTNHRRRKKPKIDLRRNDQKEAKDQAIRNAKAQAIQAAMERQKQEEESFGGGSEQGDGNRDGKHGGRRRNRGRSGGRDGGGENGAPKQNRDQNKNRKAESGQSKNRRDDGGKRREQGEKPPREGEGGEQRRSNRNRNRRRDNRPRGERNDPAGNGQGNSQRGGQDQGGSVG